MFSPRLLILVLLTSMTTRPLLAQQPDHTHIAVYQTDYAIISQSYPIALQRGLNTVRIPHIPDQLHIGSVLIDVHGEVRAVDVKPGRSGINAVLKHLVGSELTLTDASGRSFTGVLDRWEGGMVFLRLKDGSTTIIPNAQHYAINSEHLKDVPVYDAALELRIETPGTGKQTMDILYGTRGISWNADYAVVLSADEKRMEISGFATIRNSTNADFPASGIRLVAGSIQSQQTVMSGYAAEIAMSARAVGADQFQQSSFYEYYVYDLDGTMDLMQQDQKRYTLARVQNVPAQKKYRYTSTGQHRGYLEGNQVWVTYEQPNTVQSGLGRALPAGTVSIYKTENGRHTLVGRDQIPHVAADGMLRFTTGRAFDILVDEEQKEQTRVSDRVTEFTILVKMKNNKQEAIVVDVERYLSRFERVVRSSIPHTMSGMQAVFQVSLKAGEERTLEMRIRQER